jgi:hypothetical protein
MKRLLILFAILCSNAFAQPTYNAIATAYVTTTISQNVVFNSAMQQGGTFTFSALAHNGGGRPGEADTANVRIQFYAAGGSLISTVNSNYNRNLPNPNGAPGNPWADPSVPWTVLTVSSTNCGGSCANVAYATVAMYGIDGSFWAGDYGPWYRAPTLQLNGGGNLLYNPEFGPAYGFNAQGWNTNPAMGACQGAWGGSNPCIVNNNGTPGQSTVGLVANQNGGGPSTSGGTTSGTAGGYNNSMSTTNAGAGTGTPQTPPGPPPPAPTAIYMNNATVKITRAIPTTSNSPGGEGPNNAFDNNPNTKYLNFDKKNAGVTVQLNTGRVVTGFTVTTANDFSGRDPTSYKLYGSNDGVTWVLIKEDSITLSENRFSTSSMIGVTNTTAYAYYFMLFPTTKAGEGCGLNCDSMQIAELTYYYDANNNTISTASSNNIVDPVTAASGPTVEGGTITQTNSSNGQTITSGGSSTAGYTGTQQTSVTTWINTTQSANNYLYIEQVSGSFNTVNVTQSGTKNTINLGLAGTGSNNVTLNQTGSAYLNSLVQGNNNSFTSTQTNTAGSNYQETKIIGNSNAVITSQTGNSSQLMFNTINGSNNTVTATQTGTAQHYLETKLTGNGNSVLSDQSGSLSNKANIDLTNGGGPATLDLQQTGGKSFTIIQTCTNPAGCNTTVRQ